MNALCGSENPCPETRIVTEAAMTVGMTMILLYGVGGVPGEGEIPMMRRNTPQP